MWELAPPPLWEWNKLVLPPPRWRKEDRRDGFSSFQSIRTEESLRLITYKVTTIYTFVFVRRRCRMRSSSLLEELTMMK